MPRRSTCCVTAAHDCATLRCSSVATYRVDEVDDDTAHARAFSALEREADVIVLQPLAPGQVEYLLQSALNETGVTLPAAVVAEVRDLAEGRPLFAEELLRGVLERLGRDGKARPSVPTSIRAAVRERFMVLAKADASCCCTRRCSDGGSRRAGCSSSPGPVKRRRWGRYAAHAICN